MSTGFYMAVYYNNWLWLESVVSSIVVVSPFWQTLSPLNHCHGVTGVDVLYGWINPLRYQFWVVDWVSQQNDVLDGAPDSPWTEQIFGGNGLALCNIYRQFVLLPNCFRISC